jgi:two-component system cell cycle sensor histidine kinase/response regulator CckA
MNEQMTLYGTPAQASRQDSAAIRILLVEDNPGDVRLVQEMLRERGAAHVQIECAGTLVEAKACLGKKGVDVVLVDLGLPDSQGLDTCRRIRELAGDAAVVIVLTGTQDEETGLMAIREMAEDYLIKGQISGPLLVRSIRYAIERKRAEEALLDTSNRLVEAQRVMRMGSWEWDAVSDRITGSEEFYQLFDVPPEGIAKFMQFSERLHPDDRERVQRDVTDAMQHERPYDTDYRVKLSDGTWRDINGRGRVFIDADGKPVRMVGTCLDITERKLMEAALRESQEQFRIAQDMSPDGFTILQPVRDAQERVVDFTWVYENAAIARLNGTDPEAVVGQRLLELFPGHRGTTFLRAYQQVAESGETCIFEADYAGENMSKPISFRIVVVPMAGNIAILAQDITERKKAEEALRQSEERYRAILNGAAEGILIVEHHTRDIKYVNPAMCRLLGYDEDELKHLTVNDIHPAYILDRLGSDFEAHDRENKTMFLKDLECLKKDGTITYADVVITPRIIIDGRSHSVDFFMDVTQRKKAEDDKKKIEIQLLQSQKLEAVGRLTGGIAHDFNNILTTIIGNAEIMLGSLPKGDHLREETEEIRAAGERAADLIGQLLAFSRKQVLQPTIMSLNDTVHDMDRMFRRIIGEDIELRTILAPDLGLVEADQGQMEQVIMNLVVNARDAMPRGGKITIETANVELDEEYARSHIAVIPGSFVMMSVSDTGVGMTKEIQEHVFEPFFTTKEKGKGTGLGLSTVYGIVKQSKGSIWVYTELGKGTTFKIYLPRAERLISEKKKKDKKAEALTGSETILVVEDDAMVRKFAERVLKGFGYRILIAANGDEAVSIAGEYEGPIDLMLTDVVMPGMSGEDLENRLKASKPGIKVLYMSGYTDDAIVHHGILDKGKIFLQKPFTIESLGRKVKEALGD